jgi:hypothetical protein
MGEVIYRRVLLPPANLPRDLFVCLYKQPGGLERDSAGFAWAGGMSQRHASANMLLPLRPGQIDPGFTDQIYYPPRLDARPFDYKTRAVLHELAHFCGDVFGVGAIDHVGGGYAENQAYDAGTAGQRLRNADAFTLYTMDIGISTEAAAKATEAAFFRFMKPPFVLAPGEPRLPPATQPRLLRDPFAYPAGFA